MNSRPKRILFIDNEPDKIASHITLLEERGYDVTVIDRISDAEQALKNRWWHLVVVDIRLIDEQDKNDFTGLELVQNSDPITPKLILTAYPTHDAAVRALRSRSGGLPPARHFLSKLDSLGKVVDEIDAQFKQDTGINWDLDVIFDSPLTFLCMADWLHRDVRLRPKDKIGLEQSVEDSAEELADLWGKLFFGRQSVTVFPSSQGRGGALVSLAKPYDLGTQSTLVVKCGWFPDLEEEQKRYEEWVKPFAGNESTHIHSTARTLHFAAIAYTLVGGHLPLAESLNDFYRAEEADAICRALRHLFVQVCGPWYSAEMKRSEAGIDQAYREGMRLSESGRKTRLKERLVELASDAVSFGFEATAYKSHIDFQWDDTLSLDSRELIKWVHKTGSVVRGKPTLDTFSESPTHGDLNGNNILVDEHQRTWLIDFAQTGYGYRLRDFAELESVIALDLRRHAGLGTLLQFERAVLSQQSWSVGLEASEDTVRLMDKELGKALRVIQELRNLAMRWEDDDNDLHRYYLALFFEAILRLVGDVRDSPSQPAPMWRRSHALMRAAVIIDWFKQQEELVTVRGV